MSTIHEYAELLKQRKLSSVELTIAKEKGLIQVSDESALIPIIQKILNDNPKVVEELKSGKEKAMGFFVGQAMRASKGSANPQLVNKLVKELLKI